MEKLAGEHVRLQRDFVSPERCVRAAYSSTGRVAMKTAVPAFIRILHEHALIRRHLHNPFQLPTLPHHPLQMRCVLFLELLDTRNRKALLNCELYRESQALAICALFVGRMLHSRLELKTLPLAELLLSKLLQCFFAPLVPN